MTNAERAYSVEQFMADARVVVAADGVTESSLQAIGGPVWELILFGRNTMIRPRHYFDTETGSVREALPL